MRFISVLILLALGCAVPAQAGEWSTSFGTMTLPDTSGELRIFAPYDYDNGRIIGQMQLGAAGPVIFGTWVESNSAVTCDESFDGSMHWGAVQLNFDADFTAFSGEWDYCGSGDPAGAWEGKLGISRMLLLFR
jgi:hypothetical protein